MAHYALLDDNNIVLKVIVGGDEKDFPNAEEMYSDLYGMRCLRTSYNTMFGKHFSEETGKWSKSRQFRGNFAGLGFEYREDLDAFIPPKPYDSWILNQETYDWEAPIPMPEDAGTGEPPIMYIWDESQTNWILVEGIID